MSIRRIAGRVLDVVDPGNKIRNFREVYLRDSWLHKVRNIVHVGANTGQEAEKYASYGLGVLWIEPIPAVFQKLQSHISKFENQHACQVLVTDKSGDVVTFNVSSNDGLCSSIFDLGGIKEMWPDLDFTQRLQIRSQSLDDILKSDGHVYDGMVLDTQGSELLVLKGAAKSLSRFRYVKAESADFEIYKGSTTDAELIAFMRSNGFRLKRRDIFARTPSGGECSDLLFKRIN